MPFTTVQASKIAPSFHLDTNSVIVSLSDAEAQVIRHKAEKAGVSVSEYVRNAALGFPMS